MNPKHDTHLNVDKVQEILKENDEVQLDLDEMYEHEVLLTPNKYTLEKLIQTIIQFIKTKKSAAVELLGNSK